MIEELKIIRSDFLGGHSEKHCLRLYNGHTSLRAVVSLVLTSITYATDKQLDLYGNAPAFDAYKENFQSPQMTKTPYNPQSAISRYDVLPTPMARLNL